MGSDTGVRNAPAAQYIRLEDFPDPIVKKLNNHHTVCFARFSFVR